MAFTNASVQQMIEQFGERICAIGLNNGKRLLVGYQSSIQLSDIFFTTFGDVEVMGVKRVDISSGKNIPYTNYITTEFIEYVLVMDEGYGDYRVDPFLL